METSAGSSCSSMEMVEDDEETYSSHEEHTEAFMSSTAPSCVAELTAEMALDQTTRSLGRGTMPMLPLPVRAKPMSAAQFTPSPLPEDRNESEEAEDGDGGSSAAEDDDASGRDRIGAFFGYNGKDNMVPKAAYEASQHRVATLEQRLGAANREVRALTEQTEKQGTELSELQRVLAEAQLRVAELEAREDTLRAKERKLEALAKVLAGKVSSDGTPFSSNGRITGSLIGSSQEDAPAHFLRGREQERGQGGFASNRRTSIRRAADAFGTNPQAEERLPSILDSALPRLPRLNGALPQLDRGGGPRASSSMM